MEEFRSYLKNIRRFPDFREEGFSVSTLVEKIKNDDEGAVLALIESTLKYIVELARFHCAQWNAWPNLIDLIQEANLEVSKKITRFDPLRGSLNAFVGFRSYIAFVRFWKNSRVVHITDHGRKIVKHLQKVQTELAMELGREPTLEELSNRVGRDESQVQSLLVGVRDTEELLPEGEPRELGVWTKTPGPLKQLEVKELRRVLVECLDEKNADLLLASLDGTDAFQALYHQMYRERITAATARKRKQRLLEKLRNCPQAEKLFYGGL